MCVCAACALCSLFKMIIKWSIIKELVEETTTTKEEEKKEVLEADLSTQKSTMRLSQSFELPPKTDKKRYDRDFLLSIKNLATEKPIDLPTIPNVTIDGVSVPFPLSTTHSLLIIFYKN